MVTGLSARRADARIGSTEFFAPEMRMEPSSGFPPSISNLSMNSTNMNQTAYDIEKTEYA